MCFKSIINHTNHDKEIEAEFYQIADSPYDVERNNCTHKSLKFATILIHEYDCRNITFNILPHKDGEYNHAFLLWEEMVYDPTSKPPFYREDYDTYLKIMEQNGFQTQNITQSQLKE